MNGLGPKIPKMVLESEIGSLLAELDPREEDESGPPDHPTSTCPRQRRQVSGRLPRKIRPER